jgi:hypothetical protein
VLSAHLLSCILNLQDPAACLSQLNLQLLQLAADISIILSCRVIMHTETVRGLQAAQRTVQRQQQFQATVVTTVSGEQRRYVVLATAPVWHELEVLDAPHAASILGL